jgi:hypothetical protein
VLGTGLVLAVNFYLAARSVGVISTGAPAVDWAQYVEAGRRVWQRGDLYAITDTYAYHYSPLLALAFGVISPIGTTMWRILHVVAALALPSWPLRIVAFASWPFWYDVEAGNLMTFTVLAAAWALVGSRVATGAYLLLVVLVPRPLMFPVAAWILWRRPEWRVPFGTALVLSLAGAVALGWAGEWFGAMLAASGDVAIPSNIGPSRFIGAAWLLIGIPLAAWLTWRGRLGLASLAASLYWLPYYLLMLLLELVRPVERVRTAARRERVVGAIAAP